jgi:UTP-glucose-1-phosphate uridylyltransferase
MNIVRRSGKTDIYAHFDKSYDVESSLEVLINEPSIMVDNGLIVPYVY